MENFFVNKKTLISIGLIIILGFIVYSNSLNGRFILDDRSLVENNIYIKNPSKISKFFTKNIAAGSGKRWNAYRPIQMLTYMLDYSFWKLNPRGYHFTNILLHILASITVYWLINLLYNNKTLSFLTGLLFVVHPLHTGAVSYISGRADPLALIFMLVCFIFYIKFNQRKKASFFILWLLSYILALLSRENSLILPILLLLYHYTFGKKVTGGLILSIFGIASGYILLRIVVFKSILFNITYSSTLFQRIPGFFAAITNYVKLILLPFDLHMEYGNELFNFTDSLVVGGIIIVSFMLMYILVNRKNKGIVFFSLSWFFLSLLPQSNFYPINAYMAEHWLYLPIIGPLLILASALISLSRRKGYCLWARVIAISLVTFYSGLTIGQNGYWKEPIGFYERTLRYVPNSPKIRNNLGNELSAIGKHKEAINSYKKAQENDPYFVEPYYNLGNEYEILKRRDEAIALYKKAVEINPYFVASYNNLGMIYEDLGRHEDAIALYKKAISINPDLAEAYNNLANVYNVLGKHEETIALYKKAISINPDLAEAYNNLANVYNVLGKHEETIALYKKAISINPDFAEAYNNLGNVYNIMGKYEAAITLYKKAIETNPNYEEARYNLDNLRKTIQYNQ